jgi:sigma-E factor negative regulatory protein RseC
MPEQGRIIGFHGAKMAVELPRSGACSKCGICMQGEDQTKMILELENPGRVRIGDWVVLELEGKRVLQAAAFAYGIPIVGLLLGALLGFYQAPSPSQGEVFTLIGGGVGLALGLLLAVYFDRTWGRKGRFEPRIIEIIRGTEDQFAGSKDL